MKARRRTDNWFAEKSRKILCRKMEIDNNKIFFFTYQGRYDCNPKYITEQILKENLQYDLVWAISPDEQAKGVVVPDGVRLVTRGTYEFICEAASAKVWVDNAINFPWEYIQKKEGQIYFQTWHGSLGLKRINSENVRLKRWVKAAATCNKVTDYCFSNSAFETKVFRESHWPDVKILEYGHARNDFLINQDEENRTRIKAYVRKFFNIKPDDKILLYAPTFRDDKSDYFSIDFERLLLAFQQRFGGNWRILIRLHFKERKKIARLRMGRNMIDATDYRDIQDLLVTADAGMTDYSSWICDFMLTRRPCFLFASDLDSYENERGFYYPLSTTPFPLAKTSQKLVENVLSFDEKKFQKGVDAFLSDRGCIEDGHAAERIVAKIKEVMK